MVVVVQLLVVSGDVRTASGGSFTFVCILVSTKCLRSVELSRTVKARKNSGCCSGGVVWLLLMLMIIICLFGGDGKIRLIMILMRLMLLLIRLEIQEIKQTLIRH